jgi:catechol 2,3-dioxygenase-like lactoylglutathione lyase family enzyme
MSNIAPSRLHHVGIVCPNREHAETLLGVMGLTVHSEQYVAAYEADCIFTNGPGGRVELIVPRGGRLAKFNKGAGGLHHVAIEVSSLAAETERLRSDGVELLEEVPVDAGDLLINFVPPAFTRGVTVELVQVRSTKE